MLVEITLPWPPSLNRLYRHAGKRVLISAEGRKYRLQVAEELARLGNPRLEGLLEMTLLAFPPDKRRRDVDNLAKALIDCLMIAGLYQDDSQLVKLTIEKREPTPGGRVLAIVREVRP